MNDNIIYIGILDKDGKAAISTIIDDDDDDEDVPTLHSNISGVAITASSTSITNSIVSTGTSDPTVITSNTAASTSASSNANGLVFTSDMSMMERARLVAMNILANKDKAAPIQESVNINATIDSISKQQQANPAPAAVLNTEGLSPVEIALLKAKHAAMKVVSTGRAGVTVGSDGTVDSTMTYSDELEINDYPPAVSLYVYVVCL